MKDWNEELQDVVNFVVSAHAGQFRKHSGVPYVSHCFAVLAKVSEWRVFDPDTLTRTVKSKGRTIIDVSTGKIDKVTWRAALCHDVLEDCPDVTDAKLAAVIGKEAAEVVREMTFVPDPEGDVTPAIQKENYIKSFAGKSGRALVLKCADRFCNVMDYFKDDARYAAKYWAKGRPLFDIAFSRQDEIAGQFGGETLTGIKYSRDSLDRTIIR